MKGTLLSSEIAEPYAQALMSIAQSQNLTEDFGQDIRDLDALLDESAELRDFVTNPIIQDSDKKAVLRNIMGSGAHALLVNFLMLLVDKRRIVFLQEVLAQYLALLRKLNQTVLAEVITARALTSEQEQEIGHKVRVMTSAREAELKVSVDPSILGGIIIRVGSKVVDASLQGQLRQIGMSLNA
ncbi:MAG: F0F1 ATP synthase subunit delta [Spirulina sp. SIO3F2]|nr:F0F1 ATP synthase subunit delta [Spirulina sp. SIO3F2]